MSEHDLQKKLSHQCPKPFTPKPGGGGGGPPGGGKGGGPPGGGRGSGNQRGNPNPNGNPQGNPAKVVTFGVGVNPFTADGKQRIGKRDLLGNQKTSSTGDTDNSAGNPTPQGDPVPCNACGGSHSAKSHADHPTDLMCPFLRLKHPQVNAGMDEFLSTEDGKQYDKYPWDLENKVTGTKTPQKRLKFGETLENGKYVDLPPGHPAAKAKKGENPVSFIAQINNTHTPYNPFMTVTVPSLSNNREEERQRRKVGEGSVSIGKKRRQD